jgi:hypothetical protein
MCCRIIRFDVLIADRIVWGGVGTLMEGYIPEILAKHTAEIRKLGQMSKE